jgi:L-alanine-DL-glutamate epimerase-like enolase superfamily enzyme
MTRIGAYDKCGITGSMKIAAMSESFGMRTQVHGMGLENAQLCAAISNNDYYEQIVINEDQIRGLSQLEACPIVDGVLTVSDAPGLGYRFDWDALEAQAVRKVEITARYG